MVFNKKIHSIKKSTASCISSHVFRIAKCLRSKHACKLLGLNPGTAYKEHISVHFLLHHGLFGQAKNTYPCQLYQKKMISKSIAQMPMNMDDQSSKKPIAILKKEYPRGRRCTIFNLTDEKNCCTQNRCDFKNPKKMLLIFFICCKFSEKISLQNCKIIFLRERDFCNFYQNMKHSNHIFGEKNLLWN